MLKLQHSIARGQIRRVGIMNRKEGDVGETANYSQRRILGQT